MTDQCSLEREAPKNWRPVPNWPYEASSCGLIRSIRTGKILRATETHNGYLKTSFSVDSRRKDVRVHRAVTEAWIGPIPEGMQVNHIDGDKKNNDVSNLEIVTNAENMEHAVRLGLPPSGLRNGAHTKPEKRRIGELQGQAKLKTDDVVEIKRRIALGHSLAAIGRDYRVTRTTICDIKNGRSWRHVQPTFLSALIAIAKEKADVHS